MFFFFFKAALILSEIKEIEHVNLDYDRLIKKYFFFQSSIVVYKSWNPLKFITDLVIFWR